MEISCQVSYNHCLPGVVVVVITFAGVVVVVITFAGVVVAESSWIGIVEVEFPGN